MLLSNPSCSSCLVTAMACGKIRSRCAIDQYQDLIPQPDIVNGCYDGNECSLFIEAMFLPVVDTGRSGFILCDRGLNNNKCTPGMTSCRDQDSVVISRTPGTDITCLIMLISAIQALDGCISSTNSLVVPRPPSSPLPRTDPLTLIHPLTVLV
ncbi:hypothetical protein DFJ58DRAFT_162460 [Suillus subalutaceus]|uniref:uncharacterized protein n=1 Tax=Suillus subalutaceus TaxID=48586 RepID=UPI001B874C3C|nr:uncharacterized protein DFJ58DRAFT_162460 [Suillus subalutaceus]KAG1836740.1 hypothetical protein DFJ58DRAFT_162460 [Suillus subalutaceus]